MQYPTHLLKLIDTLRRLPGVGTKTAERYAFQLINWPKEHLEEMADLIKNSKDKLKHCPDCGCLMGETACSFCDTSKRDPSMLCILASIKDVFAVEQTREYKGLFHVLGGMLSPIKGKGPDQLLLQRLRERVEKLGVKEIVIALDSTIEGDATSLYIKKELAHLSVQISRLAFGLPMGSSLEFVDGGTLARALIGRRSF